MKSALKPERDPLARRLGELLQPAVEVLAGKFRTGGGHDEFEIEVRSTGTADVEVQTLGVMALKSQAKVAAVAETFDLRIPAEKTGPP